MRVITLTHANLKRPLYVLPANIGAFHWNEATACVIIYTGKEIIFPVLESVEEIKAMIEQQNAPQGQGATDVNKQPTAASPAAV